MKKKCCKSFKLLGSFIDKTPYIRVVFFLFKSTGTKNLEFAFKLNSRASSVTRSRESWILSELTLTELLWQISMFRRSKFRERLGSNKGMERGRDRTVSGPLKGKKHPVSQCCGYGIRIRRIRMFLGLLDPDPWLFLRIRILPSASNWSKKNLDFYYFVTSFWLFVFEECRKCTSESNKQK